MSTPGKRERRKTDRFRAILLLGGMCARCANDDIRVLEIDHIDNDGFEDVSGSKLVELVLSGKSTRHLQVLCSNCHSIRTYHQEVSNDNMGIQ